MKKILLYVGPVRFLEAWMEEQLKRFAGERSSANQTAEDQKKSHRKGGLN